MFTLYGADPSRAFRVKWLLCELGHPFKQEAVLPHSPEVRALNPLGKVPVLTDDEGLVLTDSIAMLHFLADRAGRFTHAPGTPERALIDARINFVLTEMEAPIWLMARHGFVLPKAERHPGMRAVSEPDFARGEANLARLLSDDTFLAGDNFTIADIVAGQTLDWAEAAKIPLQNPVAQAYLNRLHQRPGWLKARGRAWAS